MILPLKRTCSATRYLAILTIDFQLMTYQIFRFSIKFDTFIPLFPFVASFGIEEICMYFQGCWIVCQMEINSTFINGSKEYQVSKSCLVSLNLLSCKIFRQKLIDYWWNCPSLVDDLWLQIFTHCWNRLDSEQQ